MFNIIKRLLADDTFYFGVLIVLVSVTSFGLGRWSASSEEVQTPKNEAQLEASLPVVLPLVPAVATTTKPSPNAEKNVEKKYVASKSGTKYHLLWCSGAKTIKEENKIYFASKEEAQKAGYTPAANCKGI